MNKLDIPADATLPEMVRLYCEEIRYYFGIDDINSGLIALDCFESYLEEVLEDVLS